MRARALALSSLLLSSCGLSAEVEIARFCYTQPACSGGTPCLPPIPPGGTPAPIAVSLPVPLQVPPLLRDNGSRVTLRLLDALVTPTAGTTDLAGIQSVDMTVQPPSGPAVTVASYTRPPGAASVPAIDLAGRGVNVVDLAQSGTLQVTLVIAADGPPPGPGLWDADLQVCFYGKTVFPYL